MTHPGLDRVRQGIAEAARAAGRSPNSVSLLAVSKTFSAEAIEPVIAAGQRLFGENRVQEAKAKWPELRTRWPDIVLHLIGPLQSNKAAEAVALFDCIQSIDRPKIADRLAAEMIAQGRRLSAYVQVNIGREAQKAGITPDDTEAFVRYCRDELNLPVLGLMCIPPVTDDPLPHFRALAGLATRCGLTGLSMGMSGDYRQAISAGATLVRVGSAIFGGRPPVVG